MDLQTNKYSGFWVRFVATIIDTLIIRLIISLISFILIFSALSLIKSTIIIIILYFVLGTLYEILLTSFLGGTFGKLLVNCEVRDEKGKFISVSRSTGRYFAKIISILPLGIGYLMIAWDKDKQALHDKMARTYVKKNKRFSFLTTTLITAVTFLIIAAFIFYGLAIVVSTIYFSFYSSTHPLDGSAVIESLQKNCNYSSTIINDLCIVSYIRSDAIVRPEEIRNSCDIIHRKSQHFTCISTLAAITNNISVCNLSKNNYYKINCIKLIESENVFRNLANQPKNYSFNGSLEFDSIGAGLYGDEYCINKQNNIYDANDIFCLNIYNIKGFTLGSDDMVHYNEDLQILDSEGNIIETQNNMYGLTHKEDLEDGVLSSAGINSKLYLRAPGKYTYRLILYDLISNKGVIVNQTISIMNIPTANLRIRAQKIGILDGNECHTLKNHILTNGDTLCFEPIVEGLEMSAQREAWFDMDVKVFNSDSKLILNEESMYEGRGFGENPLIGNYASLPMYNLSYGSYIIQLKIIDKLGKKIGFVNETFNIVENSMEIPVLSGAIMDTLIEQEDRTYSINDNDYDFVITKTTNSTASFKVNGEEFTLKENEAFILSDEIKVILYRLDRFKRRGIVEFYMLSNYD